MAPSVFTPKTAIIEDIRTETNDVSTYRLRIKEAEDGFSFEAGQYNMVSLPGIGEAPLSISSLPTGDGTFDHTIRAVGRLTNSVAGLKRGDRVGIRGPYGRPWPTAELAGHPVVIIAGGTGIACIKPVIEYMSRNRDQFPSVEVIYGAKTVQEMVFAEDYDRWRESGLTLRMTVDSGSVKEWPCHVGVVTTRFNDIEAPAENAKALMSGPETMMKFCVVDLLARGFQPENVFVSLERRMECGVRMCGHCQLGPKYVCQDGPVFPMSEVKHLFGVVH